MAPLILMYHQIAEPPPTAVIKGMYVTPQQLDWQIRYLKRRGFRFTTFRQLLERPADARCVMLTLDDGYANNYHNALPILRNHGIGATVYPILNDLGKRDVRWPEAVEQSPAEMLSREQIREMVDADIEFGSHLLDHKSLCLMSDAEQMRQLSESKLALQEITGQEVLSIAYPYGEFDAEAVQRTAAAGYRYGLTTQEGINPPRPDPLRLNRFTAKGCKRHHPLKFRRMLHRVERNVRDQWPA